MRPKWAVTVAMRARPVVKGENLRHVACLLIDSCTISGVTSGRHCEAPTATNCELGIKKGRAWVTASCLIEPRCQNKVGMIRLKMYTVMATLEVRIRSEERCLERCGRAKEADTRLSNGTASSAIVVEVHSSQTRHQSSKLNM
jgi:hypothetical protein